MELIIKIRNKIIGAVYRNVAKRIFFAFDPEDVHDRMTSAGKFLGSNFITRGFTSVAFNYTNPVLEQNILGINFKNPIGLSAGFDKEGVLTGILPEVGLGFEEIGSITAKAYEGNPKPRLFRLPKESALRVNYGLKSSGADIIYERLKKLKFRFPIGISVAKTNSQSTSILEPGVLDYLYTYKKFLSIGDYFTINISCPNTCEEYPIFAKAENLDILLKEFFLLPKNKPVLVKLSPDLKEEELFKILNVCAKYPVDGFVCSNLTKINNFNHEGKGGFSGKAVLGLSNDLITKVYKFYQGKKLIIGSGGVFNANDAYEKIKLGASLIQLITGMVFMGPQVISEINLGLVELLKKDGYKNISEAVGVKNRR